MMPVTRSFTLWMASGALAAMGQTTPALPQIPGATTRVVADSVTQKLIAPTALSIGDQGELYITESPRLGKGAESISKHPELAASDLAIGTVTERRSFLEQLQGPGKKFPADYFSAEKDRIRVMPDPEKPEIFLFSEGYQDSVDGPASGLLAYDNSVYFSDTPKIWLLGNPNSDHGAQQKSTLIEGFGVHISEAAHSLGSLILGPDGRLWGTMGDRGLNVVDKDKKITSLPDDGCVFRMEPDGSHFEIIQRGLRNPQGLAFDDQGNLIVLDDVSSDKEASTRVILVTPGADAGWRIGYASSPIARKSWTSDPAAYISPAIGTLPIKASSLIFQPGTGVLREEAGSFLASSASTDQSGGLISFRLESNSGALKSSAPKWLIKGTPLDALNYSPDGKLYAISTDKVFSFSANDAADDDLSHEVARAYSKDFKQRPSAALEKMLTHADIRIRTRAEIELTRRSDGLEILTKSAAYGNPPLVRLHAVWGLGIIARNGAARIPSDLSNGAAITNDKLKQSASTNLARTLADKDPAVRAHSLWALADAQPVKELNPQVDVTPPRKGGANPLATLESASGKMIIDPNPLLRRYGLISAARIQSNLMTASLWAALDTYHDPDFIRGAAYALSRTTIGLRNASTSTLENKNTRLASVIALRFQKFPGLTIFSEDADHQIAEEAIRGIVEESIDPSRRLIASLLNPEKITSSGKRTAAVWNLILANAYQLGEPEQFSDVIEFSLNASMPDASRELALELLQAWATPATINPVTGMRFSFTTRDPAPLKAAIIKNRAALKALKAPLRSKAEALLKAYES
jgi:quinoprotein glucose dehydrogenase